MNREQKMIDGTTNMDLFETYLNEKEPSEWVIRALTDKSYKHEKNRKQYEKPVNSDLATFGDAVIKFCYCRILLDNVEELTNEKAKYESDKTLVEVVAKHYDLLKYIRRDSHDPNLATNYDYDRNRSKYIATAVEAMIGAIYMITDNLDEIEELLRRWKDLKDNQEIEEL